MITEEVAAKECLDCVGNFRFEYSTETKEYELEGEIHIGYDVLVKMVDGHGENVTASVQDITSEPEIVQNLVQLLDMFKISPMCLEMFVKNFLVGNVR